MNKSVLLSIRPEWVLKILTHKKTIEVRKQFPKDYKGWVYIYCTKGKPYFYGDENGLWVSHLIGSPNEYHWNGKVVARFWCDNVEEITTKLCLLYGRDGYGHIVQQFDKTILEKSLLNATQLKEYLGTKNGYAIHISKLEIFDEPRELFEFEIQCKKYKKTPISYSCRVCTYLNYYTINPETRHLCITELTKAPQNYCYVEGEEQ